MLPLLKEIFPLKEVIHKIIVHWILSVFLKMETSWMTLEAEKVVLIHRTDTSLLAFLLLSFFCLIVFKFLAVWRLWLADSSRKSTHLRKMIITTPRMDVARFLLPFLFFWSLFLFLSFANISTLDTRTLKSCEHTCNIKSRGNWHLPFLLKLVCAQLGRLKRMGQTN